MAGCNCRVNEWWEANTNMMTARGTLRLSLLFVLAAVVNTFVASQDAAKQESDETAKSEVLNVSQQLVEATNARDRAALDRILADRLSWTSRGERLSKDQVIANYLSGNMRFKSFSHDNVVVNIFGSTAVVTGHSTSVVEYKGKLFDAPRLFTDVFIKMDGRWQLVVHHVSELAKP